MPIDPGRIYDLPSDKFGIGGIFAAYNLAIELPGGGLVRVGRFSQSALPALTIYAATGQAVSVEVGALCEFAQSEIIVGGAHRNDSFFNLNLGGTSSVYKELMDQQNRALCRIREPAPIKIGNNVVVSTGALILEGASIGTGCVIAAGAVVTGCCEECGIYGGVPARRIRDRFPSEREAALYKATRLPDVHAFAMPVLPNAAKRLQDGDINLNGYLEAVAMMDRQPWITIAGTLTGQGKISLTRIVGYHVGDDEVVDERANAKLTAYFSQFWERPNIVKWTPDIFHALGLYGSPMPGRTN